MLLIFYYMAFCFLLACFLLGSFRLMMRVYRCLK